MPKSSRELTRSLDRARCALEKGRRRERVEVAANKCRSPAATAFAPLALVLFIVALATGHYWLLYLAAVAAVAGGGLMLASGGAGQLLGGFAGSGDATHAQVGMGATVAADAVLEPGARVEMGATVGAGATVRSGAVVRMGSTVGARAVIERGATVSWGASVHDSAVVEEDAIVGAGSAVLSGARVPAGTWLRPGTTFGGRAPTAPRPQPAASLADPRLERVGSACDKLEAELRASPERVREFLGGSEETIATLRRTCEDLARRERELAAEVDATALARLDEERAGLEKRIASQRDETAANSLRGALAAIDEQKRQREILKVRAERLDAEQTRLMYTLEGLASQFVRMRTSAAQPGSTAEVERSVAQLRSELEAIADALDEVALDAPPDRLRNFAEQPTTPNDVARSDQLRTRE